MILYLTPKSKICLVLEGILFTKHNVARVKWLLGILDISAKYLHGTLFVNLSICHSCIELNALQIFRGLSTKYKRFKVDKIPYSK